MTMVDFWTSIPLMALAAVIAGTLLLVLSVTDHRRTETVPLRLDGRRDREHAEAPGPPR
jgi:hypothetical protein